mgnify:CR=1 FL=1
MEDQRLATKHTDQGGITAPSIPKYKAQPPLIQRSRNNYYHLLICITLINKIHALNRIRDLEGGGFKKNHNLMEKRY